jgi:hypothetical protein
VVRSALLLLRSKSSIQAENAIYARHLDSSVRALGLEVLRTPISSPKANAICERLIGTMEHFDASAWTG